MKKEMTVDAVLENLHPVQQFLEPFLLECRFPLKDRLDVEMAVEEVFLNIASYAYAPEQGQAVIAAETDGTGLTVTFTDSGKPFDSLSKPDPDVKTPWQDRQVGGLGIYMVKQTMDHVSYERREGQNVLCFRKAVK